MNLLVLRDLRAVVEVHERGVPTLVPLHQQLDLSLLSGEEMTAQRADLSRSRGRVDDRSFHFTDSRYAVARALEKVAVLTRLFAMTPNPTQRCIPSSPW